MDKYTCVFFIHNHVLLTSTSNNNKKCERFHEKLEKVKAIKPYPEKTGKRLKPQINTGKTYTYIYLDTYVDTYVSVLVCLFWCLRKLSALQCICLKLLFVIAFCVYNAWKFVCICMQVNYTEKYTISWVFIHPNTYVLNKFVSVHCVCVCECAGWCMRLLSSWCHKSSGFSEDISFTTTLKRRRSYLYRTHKFII